MLSTLIKAATLAAVAILLPAAHAKPDFVNRIPNGGNVPNPCGSGFWTGVGHTSQYGGGSLNVFGNDFDDVSENRWTEAICKKDSDGDGKTNGEELGDPGCTWKEGDANPSGMITHPGICEPIDSETCKKAASNQFLKSMTCTPKMTTSGAAVTTGQTGQATTAQPASNSNAATTTAKSAGNINQAAWSTVVAIPMLFWQLY